MAEVSILSLPPAVGSDRLPTLFQAVPESGRRFWEFFTVNIRNPNTRRAYFKAVQGFSAWCGERGLRDLSGVMPMHVAAYVEQLGRTHSKPTVKQHLAAIRMLFDWLVTGHIMDTNPAHAVRGPKHSVRKGKTTVLSAEEMHELLAAIETTSLLGLRDRALIALMGYTFARVGAATGMKVEDFYVQKRRSWVRLHEKGGKVTELPCHHNLDQYLEEWIAASGLGTEPESPLFPPLRYGRLTDRTSLPQANVHLMIQRRAKAAGLKTKISAHSFRVTGITTYLQNGGKLEIAQQMAGHESARTTGLYDRRDDTIALDEVERMRTENRWLPQALPGARLLHVAVKRKQIPRVTFERLTKREGVLKRMALARPVLSTDKFCAVIPTSSANVFKRIFRRASMTSTFTTIGMELSVKP